MSSNQSMLDDVQARLPSSSTATLLYAGTDHVAAIVGPILTVIARGEPEEPIVSLSPRWVDRLLARYPKKGAYLVVVQAAAKPPSDAARRRIDHMYVECARGATAGAMVIEGKGFLAASIRSALSILSLTSKLPYPQKTFATLGEAAPFLSGRLPAAHPFSPAQIVAGVEELRAAYEANVGVFSGTARHG